MTYDITPIEAPIARGGKLKLLVGLIESGLTGSMLSGTLLGSAGILTMRTVVADTPPYEPHHLAGTAPYPDDGPTPHDLAEEVGSLPPTQVGHGLSTCRAYTEAYLAGTVTPVQVVQRLHEALAPLEGGERPMGLFIARDEDDVLAQAERSAERYAAGAPLGPFDGVPVAVKDELDQVPYPTTVGTSFLGTGPAEADATVVARLREAGAILVGKANMHEIGIGVTGVNPHHGAARNAYDPACFTGGSSSGSAAAVAAGVVPLAVGADGGGSIRMPAGLCGVVGLKPTFGRVSEHGAAPLCWSVAHVGPIGATVDDVALGYALMAGQDPADPHTMGQPRPTLQGVGDGALEGVKVGMFAPWFEDAEPDVVARCREAVQHLVDAGATVVEVTIPELALCRTVHLVTIVSEMVSAHLDHYRQHRKEYGHDTRINMALGHRLQATDYVLAQQLRTRIAGHFGRVFEQVDCLVTPTTGCTAKPIEPDALAYGESDLGLTTTIMRFAQAGNLTGHPAISVPAGYDGRGMPVGLQIMGRHWDEALLLRLARVVEAGVEQHRPQVHVDLLG